MQAIGGSYRGCAFGEERIFIRFLQEDKPFGELMFYPQENNYAGSGLARSFSKPGSSNSIPLAPLSLKTYNPEGALEIFKDLIARALGSEDEVATAA